MFTQSTSQKRKPRKFPDSVIQGSRILGQTGGRPAQMYRNEKSSGICPAESPLEKPVGQLAFLDPYNCDSMQGYLFSAPVPAAVAGDLLWRQAHGKLDLKEAQVVKERV